MASSLPNACRRASARAHDTHATLRSRGVCVEACTTQCTSTVKTLCALALIDSSTPSSHKALAPLGVPAPPLKDTGLGALQANKQAQ